MTDLLEDGRAAFARRRWGVAWDRLTAADRADPLEPDDLELLARVAYLIGRDEASAATWARAHQARVGRDDAAGAALCAFWAGFTLANRHRSARAGGWFATARRLVDEHALDGAASGYLLLPAGLGALGDGQPAEADELFRRAATIGARFDDGDLLTIGRLGQGQAAVANGDVAGGMALLDEALVAVTSERASAIVAGIVYCAVIETCHAVFDLRRAHEWTEALDAWCATQPDLVPYRGDCLVHRSEILRLHGDWSDALGEARDACTRLAEPDGQPALGAAYYQLAELHRLRGALDDAERAYETASAHGHSPQPGLALLRLAGGDVGAAAGAIRRVLGELRELPPNAPRRPRVLDAATEILLLAGDLDAAGAAASDLREYAAAADGDAPYLDAMAAHATGSVLLARSEPADALVPLRRARTIWRSEGAPYEAARAGVRIGCACRALGDEDTGSLELRSARQVFDDLGAVADLAAVDGLLDVPGPASDHPLSPRELEVLQLVVAGETNRAIADALTISERTVDRHVSNMLTKMGVPTRAAATAWAYRHGLVR